MSDSAEDALTPACHACRFRLAVSYRVGLLQVRGIAVSGCVALHLALPGGVVTWFVTGSRAISTEMRRVAYGRPSQFRCGYARFRQPIPRPAREELLDAPPRRVPSPR